MRPITPPAAITPPMNSHMTPYPFAASRAWRQLPVAAQVANGTMENSPAMPAMNSKD